MNVPLLLFPRISVSDVREKTELLNIFTLKGVFQKACTACVPETLFTCVRTAEMHIKVFVGRNNCFGDGQPHVLYHSYCRGHSPFILKCPNWKRN